MLMLLLCVIDIRFYFVALRWVYLVDLNVDQAVYNFLSELYRHRKEKQFFEKAKQHFQ